MEIALTDYMLYKALILLVLAVLVNFFYSLFTGRTLGQGRSDTPPAREDQAEP